MIRKAVFISLQQILHTLVHVTETKSQDTLSSFRSVEVMVYLSSIL